MGLRLASDLKQDFDDNSIDTQSSGTGLPQSVGSIVTDGRFGQLLVDPQHASSH